MNLCKPRADRRHFGLVLLITLLVTLFPAIARAERVSAGSGKPVTKSPCKLEDLGTFSAERISDEHAYRHQFDLWRCGEMVFGLYLSTAGLHGQALYPQSQIVGGTQKPEDAARLDLANDAGIKFSGKLTADALDGMVESGPSLKLVRMTRFAQAREGAPHTFAGFQAWNDWVNAKLLALDNADPGLQAQKKSCLEQGRDCLNYGNFLKYRGRLNDAKTYWTKACANGEAAGCRFAKEADAKS